MIEATAVAPPIPVVAAVVLRGQAVLLCQRHDGEHLPLLWEFPGGKVDPGETPEQALCRELAEELGVEATVQEQLAEVRHAYPEKRVWLRFFRTRISGRPQARVHRRILWVPIRELDGYAVPPANDVIVRRLLGGDIPLS